jgi:hypothetical protein
VGTPYSQQITTSFGASFFTVTSGSLPLGLTLSHSGALSGTPILAGSSNFTIFAHDALVADSRSYSLTVVETTPRAPVIGTATAGDAQASVTFTAPSSNGGAAITGYTVTASPGGATGTGTSSPIIVTGLTNGTAYTFTVTATNSVGTGQPSAASNSVTPASPQTITFNNPGAQALGTTPTLTATSSSGLTVAFASATTGVCTITSGGALTFVSAGTCTITADQSGDASFLPAAQVVQNFTVNTVVPAAPVIGTATAGDAQASVTFTASNGGAAITGYTVTASPGGATGTGTSSPIIVTGLTNGIAHTFTVTATNSVGTGQPSAASNSVTPASPQTITFNNPGAQALGTTPTLTATSSSGLTVAFASTTTGVCTITSGGALTFVSAGTCTITASQAGNASFAAATDVVQSFNVIQPVLISLSASKGATLIGEPVTYTATVSGGSGGAVSFSADGTTLCAAAPLSSDMTATCEARFTTPGTHTVEAVYGSVSAETQTVTSDQTGTTTKTVSRFMSQRGNAIVTSMFNADRQVDRLAEAEGARGAPQADGPAGAGFAASLDQAGTRLGGGQDTGNVTAMGLGMRGSPSIPAFFNRQSVSAGGLDALADDEETDGRTFSLGGPARLSGQLADGTQLSFSTSLRQIMQFRQHERAGTAAEGAAGLRQETGLFQTPTFSPFDVWVEGKYGGFRDSGDLDGHFGLLTAGADYVFNPSFLAGVFVQYGSMAQKSREDRTDVSGHGWMAGPYATLRLSPHLFWQGRAAWGSSSNDVSPFMTYTDSFDSTRWLASTSLTGRYVVDLWTIKPEIAFTYFEDESHSYRDTFGNVMPRVSTSLGQLKLGPTFSYRYEVSSNLLLEPNFGGQLIWNDTDADALGLGDLGEEALGPDGVRGRVEAGVRAQTSSGTSLDLSGSYDGIGAGSFHSYTGRAMVRVPMN